LVWPVLGALEADFGVASGAFCVGALSGALTDALLQWHEQPQAYAVVAPAVPIEVAASAIVNNLNMGNSFLSYRLKNGETEADLR
jgi:uncharacterized membrane protein YgdD (TMEM256/DUF423 family)